MNNITFKITPRGEGKTKWLLDVAHDYEGSGRKVYLYTDDESKYAKFCEKYFKTFGRICFVERLTSFKLTSEDVVLVDDLLSHDTAISDFIYIHNNSYAMYVTLEGQIATEEKSVKLPFEQLRMDFVAV